ncbi:MAG: hypothetical protein ACRC1Z_06050 [Waterburya sp.]
MWSNTPQGERACTLEMRNSDISYIETKTTTQDLTTKQSAAARTETAFKESEIEKEVKSLGERLTASVGQNKVKSEQVHKNIGEDKKAGRVDYIVNKDWEKQVEELDSTGIPVNKTVINLLKMYTPEQVKSAIAIFRSRKRDQHIPNPSGYFVAALKEGWASKQIVTNESTGEIDTATVFRHWYDLARELGYCSSQEIRDGEQWVCISGTWEKWADAVKRGYSLEYLKKIMKRNSRQ